MRWWRGRMIGWRSELGVDWDQAARSPASLILSREIFGWFFNESFWMDSKNHVSQALIVWDGPCRF